MPQQKSYAIRCSTEEQERECRELNIAICHSESNDIKWYTIISYDEAISLWLLGEKKELQNVEPVKELEVCPICEWGWKMSYWYLVNPIRKNEFPCPNCNPVKEYPYHKDEHWDIVIHSRDNPVKESPSEDIVEKIVQEWIWTHWENRAIYWREMEKILKKFLSK